MIHWRTVKKDIEKALRYHNATVRYLPREGNLLPCFEVTCEWEDEDEWMIVEDILLKEITKKWFLTLFWESQKIYLRKD